MVIVLILNMLGCLKRRNVKKNQNLFDFFTLFIKKNTNFASLSFYRCGVKKLSKLKEWQFDCWIVDKVLKSLECRGSQVVKSLEVLMPN